MDYGKEFRKYAIKHHGISSTKVDHYIGSSIHSPQDMTRTVIEERQMPFREVDVFSRLMADRIIFLGTGIDDYIANVVQAQLLFLESSDAKRDIQIYINSPGGSVTAVLAIYDVMQYIKPDVATIVIGQACSMGSFLANSGAAGKRFVLPESRTMVHRVSSGTPGTRGSVHVQELQFEDAKRSFEESIRLNERLTEIYVKHNTVGKTYEEFVTMMKFDTFVSATEAVELGLADKVIYKR